MIIEIGADAVRCCHYQHSDYFYSLCDKAGIMVWAEIPQVDEIGTGRNSPKPRATSCSTSSGKTSIIRRFLCGACSMKSAGPPAIRTANCRI